MVKVINRERDARVYELKTKAGLTDRDIAKILPIKKSAVSLAYRRVLANPESYPQLKEKGLV